MAERPRGREQNITGQGKDVYKRGSGLGTGPVGNSGGYAGRGQAQQSSAGKRAGGGSKTPLIVVILALLLGGGGFGVSNLLGGGSGEPAGYTEPAQSYQQSYTQTAPQQQSYTQAAPSQSGSSSLGSLLSGFTSANVSSGWTREANTGKPDSSVAPEARAKRTTIMGNGQDTVTIMVYMCGADLESKSGMASSDLQEMANATIGKNVNVIVYTGGATKWNNSVVSNKTNQIYKVESGGLKRLESDMGSVSMTKPSTLSGFISYCAKNFPANRNCIIFWDHGGGSISGYGYDEKFTSSGSMSLKGINEAMKAGGVTFDFIGFDACLMATVENAMMLTAYGDYLIASEETEPGVGWYYTNWLTALSNDTSMPTLEIGRRIADDFVSVCAQKCNGQKTTLSVVDLAELEKTVPKEFSAFSASTLDLLQNNSYQQVSDARSSAREFATSSKVDQVDLVSLADRIGTDAASELADAILGAVKYNRTSSNMTDAYGLSVYFPYQKTGKVSSAVAAYEAIGMDSDYAECIQKFASLEGAGQAVSGGSASPLNALLGGYSGSSSAAYGSTDMISSILSGLMGTPGFGRSLDMDSDVQYLSENYFDAQQLVWTNGANGDPVMYLSEQQWDLVHDLELNVFVDDGEGYIDLGLDNVFEFTEDGGLVGTYGGTWLSIDGQPVAYYHMDTVDDGDNYTITGRVPALLNDERVNLILVFDNDNPYGYIAGAERVYAEEETETVSKSMLQLEDGDVIDFICDYYAYDGTYLDSYCLGDRYTVSGTPEISDTYLTTDHVSAVYRFTDLYNQQYWTTPME